MSEPTERIRQQQDAAAKPASIPLRRRLFGTLAASAIRLLGATWRIRIEGPDPRPAGPQSEPGPPHLAALFHESFLVAAYIFRDRGYTAAVSRSRDGDRIAAVLERLGYSDPARGSSSRGGSAALLGLVRTLDRGTSVSVLIDGPRGPARRAKPGILTLARQANRPIQPVAFEAKPALRLGSWDRALIPLPFARVVCAFGPPLRVESGGDYEGARADEGAPGASDERDAALLQNLENTLRSLTTA